ncbi:hypothetical protein [uncultured Rhodospira sp.]|uniref:hypothetical protein n=1 Tax=uncultured Rhodospira sp. TaxID=1936189 RepID=UPI00261CBF9F|nr:hypothetical protein [uncultured Rhodospira sp.]
MSRRPGRIITVLVCPLDGVNGADGGLAANAVWHAVRRREGLRARLLPGSPTATLRRDGGLVSLLSRTQSVGRAWLTEYGADALIWGQRAGDVLRLSVVGARPRRTAEDPLGLHPWSTIQVTMPLSEGAAHLLHTLVLAAVTPSAAMPERRRADHRRALARALVRAEALLLEERAPAGEMLQGYRLALGLAQRAHGLLSGDPVRLARAVRLMETGLDALAATWPRDLIALARVDWADAVLALPEHPESRPATLGAARLDAVVAAYRAAAARLSPYTMPDTYCAVHVTLARALWRVARRDGDAGALDAALSALTAVAWVWSPETEPARRGVLMEAMKAVLRDRTARPGGGAGAIRAVLEVVPPHEDSEAWAWARAALGAALLTADPAPPDSESEAVEALREALGVFESVGPPGAADRVRDLLHQAYDAQARRLAADDLSGRVVAFQRLRA